MNELIKNINALMEDYDFAQEKILSIDFQRKAQGNGLECLICFLDKEWFDEFAKRLGIETVIEKNNKRWTIERGSKDDIRIVRYEPK